MADKLQKAVNKVRNKQVNDNEESDDDNYVIEVRNKKAFNITDEDILALQDALDKLRVEVEELKPKRRRVATKKVTESTNEADKPKPRAKPKAKQQTTTTAKEEPPKSLTEELRMLSLS